MRRTLCSRLLLVAHVRFSFDRRQRRIAVQFLARPGERLFRLSPESLDLRRREHFRTGLLLPLHSKSLMRARLRGQAAAAKNGIILSASVGYFAFIASSFCRFLASRPAVCLCSFDSLGSSIAFRSAVTALLCCHRCTDSIGLSIELSPKWGLPRYRISRRAYQDGT